MTELVAGMAPGLPETAVRRIVSQADGIPLYAVETFWMLLDSGRLEVVEGGFRATGSLDKLDIPPTLHALIAARLDALAADDRALLGWSRGDFERCLTYREAFEGEEVPLNYLLAFNGIVAAAAALHGDLSAASEALLENRKRLDRTSDPQTTYSNTFGTA